MKPENALHWEETQERWQKVREAAMGVLENWEKGDLAAAVRDLAYHLGALDAHLAQLREETGVTPNPQEHEPKAKF